MDHDSTSRSPSVTDTLVRLRDGDRSAFDDLAPLVYDELKALARRHMNGQRRGHTLQATDLVSLVFERLLRLERPDWDNRPHFISAAVCTMRSVLVDHARTRGRVRRKSPGERVPLDDIVDEIESQTTDLVAFDESLRRMEAEDPRMARVVEHVAFGRLTVAETAAAMGLSKRTVERELACARAWLLKDGA
jgi:RNA polymerase sigma-70 factor, ECF subfamily